MPQADGKTRISHSRRSLLAFALLLAPLSAQAAAPTECPAAAAGKPQLQLTFENVRSARGSITVSVYGDRPEDFLAKGAKLMKIRFPAQQGTTRGCVALPKPGTYALSVYHDEDGSGKLTSNMVGLPVEGYGFSNNPEVVLALPSFASAAFTAQAATTALTIQLKYP